jgi:hypothetical protein
MGIFDRPDGPAASLTMMPREIVVEVGALAGIAAKLIIFLYYWPKLPDNAATGMASTGLNRSAMFTFVT